MNDFLYYSAHFPAHIVARENALAVERTANGAEYMHIYVYIYTLCKLLVDRTTIVSRTRCVTFGFAIEVTERAKSERVEG